MRIRGVIEGFYGPPWSHADRLDLLAFCGRHGLDTWVHAPKDDPYHRGRWREPYPVDDIARFGELVRTGERYGVEVVWAIAPGLDVCYSRDPELEAVLAKCEQLRSAGVRSFQLLWDDVDDEFHCPDDERRYGRDESTVGAAQRDMTNRVQNALAQPAPLVVCPMGYAGTEESAHRHTFSDGLDQDVVVYWTGPEVVSPAVTREELDAASASFGGRAMLLWENYPVNDFAPERLFLGPLSGRDARLVDGPLVGLVANGMVQAIPSKLALATVGEWCRDPAGYDPVSAFERALRDCGAEVLEAVRALAADAAPVQTEIPQDVPGLVAALETGVDAATAVRLLEPFV